MIVVCSLSDHEYACKKYKASHLISLIDPDFLPNTPKKVKYHLKLTFDDIVEIKSDNLIYRESGIVLKPQNINAQLLPNRNHINKIIDFIAKWDHLSPLIIHCWCGVSRSMAAVVYILCKINPNNIDYNIKYIRSVAPHANPNKLMISMFEEHLQKTGEIISALNKYPHTVSYDCETNFAPVSVFNINKF